jgi:PAT family beta-lactamase induction signal transducer AmpG
MSKAVTIPIPREHNLPALSENAYVRYFSFSALYTAQGIPEGLNLFAIPAWMAMNGKTPAEIGAFVGVVLIPWSFKILVAPLMDRFTFLPMGRRRPWVLVGQLGLIVTFILMAFIKDPLNNLSSLMMAGFWVSFFGAFQDVATDGMAIDIIPVNQQARANGFMWGSKIIGTSVSMAVGSWLINEYSFLVALTSLSTIVVLIMLIPLCIKERPGEKLVPWARGKASEAARSIQLDSFKSVFRAFFKVFRLQSSLVMVFICFATGLAFNLTSTLLSVFTVQELGWSDQLFSKTTATGNMIGGLAGIIAGGILVDRFGKKRMLNIYLAILILIVCTLSFSKFFWSSQAFVTAFILSYYLVYTFIVIAIFSVCMQLSWKKISITQFTFYMMVNNIGMACGAASLGFLKTNLQWSYVILIIAVLAAIAIVLFRFIQFDKQAKSLAKLEAVV